MLHSSISLFHSARLRSKLEYFLNDELVLFAEGVMKEVMLLRDAQEKKNKR